MIPLCVILFGGFLLSCGESGAASCLCFFALCGVFHSPIEQLINMTQLYQEGGTGFRRYLELMRTQPEVRDCPEAVDAPALAGNIAFENVSFSYATGPVVLRNIELRVRAGEYLALVGTSGVGKTTLCSLIPRFYDVCTGAVRIDGRDVRSMTLASAPASGRGAARRLSLFRHCGRKHRLWQAGRQPGGNPAGGRAGRGARVYQRPAGRIRHGHRPTGRAAFRRAAAAALHRPGVSQNPPILILDEATSALDSESERVVQQSLGRLAEARTTLVIAHRLSTIRKAHRILVLSEAGICEEGTHEALFAKGR